MLVDALRNCRSSTTSACSTPDGPGHDRTAAQALLELGDAARAPLIALLDDDRPAPLAGSEAATLSALHGYRRSDFAYRYLSKLLGREPASPPSRRSATRRSGRFATSWPER